MDNRPKRKTREPLLIVDNLQCPICCTFQDEMLCFPCDRDEHVACRSCAEQYANDDGDVVCPRCTIPFKDRKVSSLTVDPFHAKLARLLTVACR